MSVTHAHDMHASPQHQRDVTDEPARRGTSPWLWMALIVAMFAAALVWLRRDLRTDDHAALAKALSAELKLKLLDSKRLELRNLQWPDDGVLKFRHGGRFWGWLTAWLNLIGLITVLAAINVGTFNFFVGSFGSFFGIEAGYWSQLIFLMVMTGIQAIINHLGIRATTKLTDLSGYLILGGAVLLTIALLA